MSDEAQCRSAYLYLLLLTDRPERAPAYIYAWIDTVHCDHVVDLSAWRSSVIRHSGFREGDLNEARALKTMMHYRDGHRRLLRGLLTPGDLFWYDLLRR
jgi:hypothetical protein